MFYRLFLVVYCCCYIYRFFYKNVFLWESFVEGTLWIKIILIVDCFRENYLKYSFFIIFSGMYGYRLVIFVLLEIIDL